MVPAIACERPPLGPRTRIVVRDWVEPVPVRGRWSIRWSALAVLLITVGSFVGMWIAFDASHNGIGALLLVVFILGAFVLTGLVAGDPPYTGGGMDC